MHKDSGNKNMITSWKQNETCSPRVLEIIREETTNIVDDSTKLEENEDSEKLCMKLYHQQYCKKNTVQNKRDWWVGGPLMEGNRQWCRNCC